MNRYDNEVIDGLISVIVPVYNVEKYIERCLLSIINQTYKELEIIVVDDGGSDNSKEKALELAKKDPRLKVFSQENKGLSGARNTGLELAKGEYISFVDSDDWLPLNFYKELLEIMENEKSDVITTEFYRADKIKEKEHVKVRVLGNYIEDKKLEVFLDSAIRGRAQYVAVCSKLYKRTAIDDIKFEEGKIYEDIYFNWQVFNNIEKLTSVSGIYYYYYINPNSITKRDFSMKAFDLLHATNLISTDYKGSNRLIKKYITQYQIRAHFSILVKLLKSHGNNKELILNEHDILKKNLLTLLNSHLPLSRKLALVFITIIPKSFLRRLNK